MLEDAAGIRRVVLACGTVDLRKGIDGLATIIGDKYGQNPFEKGTLFLFCGKRSDRCKGLLWMSTGFLLLYKRFEAGRLSWPRNTQEAADLTEQTVQVSYDGFKSPGSQNQRCRSEKYLLKHLYKTEKIYFLFWC
jgi:transposase